MEIPKPTSEKLQDNRPGGGFFVCPEYEVTSLVHALIQDLPRIRDASELAKEHLRLATMEWEVAQARGKRSSYGKSLEIFASPERERLLVPEEIAGIIEIETLLETAHRYQDALSAIRKNAVEVAWALRPALSYETSRRVDDHAYGLTRGPFGWEFVYRQNHPDEPLVLFDCDVALDPSIFCHAGYQDYIELIVDVQMHGWLEVDCT